MTRTFPIVSVGFLLTGHSLAAINNGIAYGCDDMDPDFANQAELTGCTTPPLSRRTCVSGALTGCSAFPGWTAPPRPSTMCCAARMAWK